ncbi:putative nuclear migration protein [Aspergillus heteromorphus CBS 117.55]|uniref:Putative nuclear migration protein n=1 Tax=Aspergillus heteromorphus CBS 117.55 TaxID=1448321 RepID=A0A317VJ94_9EURO|nr:putative nuclear migration protein [Aspergillus heteromorphus CBS 117.55]PWY72922.1 putative nuclear migration protein [Aspergillus heteromorphus CBS 117.55]
MSTIEDPFVSNLEGAVPRESHRYSSFDTQLFSLDAASPAQAKRALEAHLAETERRLEEAGKLGTALIQQQKELEDKLKEVEQQQEVGQIGPELRRKLADLEREYNEIGRETARAFLAPKRLAGGDESHFGTPYEQKSPISPALFASQATNSPSKVSVPSRKQRNQPSSRVHDIEFATEISTSLLAQVRQLQTMLAEREEALKTLNLEKSRLELEAEGYAQRIRALDESEERYKDENWALETRTHELTTAVKEAADREDRLNSSLSILTTEKSTMDRELEDLKQTNAKLVEDHTAAQKANDAEIHLLRRNLNAGDAEKLALQQKLEELNSQNQELAKAVAMRLRQHETDSTREISRGSDSDDQDQSTPDNSPPPSPNKFTPRHNHLETETLRSSLGHAHRMIQNLKSTIHREKTEKIDLKRMLQDARDEIEQRRREAAAPTNPSNKRQKTKTEPARKAPRPDLLGAGRKKAEIEIHDSVHDSDWEDNATDGTPPHKAPVRSSKGRTGGQSSADPSDAYQTATELDDAFETANERETATESDAFQTGLESMADDSTDSDELTETEDPLQRTPRGSGRVSSFTMAKTRDRISYQSSASTSGDEEMEEDDDLPSPSQVSTPRYRLRQKRSVLRKIRPSGEAPMASSSRPSSARESPATGFDQGLGSGEGQSLFMELADLDGDEDEGDFGPPMRYDTASQSSTPRSTPRMLPTPDSRRPSEAMLDAPRKPVMVDSGVMTEPWSPEAVSPAPAVVSVEEIRDVPTTPKAKMSDASTATETEKIPELAHAATQWAPLEASEEEMNGLVAEVQQKDPVQPLAPMEMAVSSVSFQETAPVAPRLPQLSTSYSVAVATEPVKCLPPGPPEITLSSISSQGTQPVLAKLPEPKPVYVADMAISSINFQDTLPVVPALPEPIPPVSLSEHGTNTETPDVALSLILSQQTEPVEAVVERREPIPQVLVDEVEATVDLPELSLSSILSQETQPVVAILAQAPEPEIAVEPVETKEELPVPELSISSISCQQTEPVEAILERREPTPEVTVEPVLADLAISFIPPEYIEPVSPQAREVSAPRMSLSNVSSVETLPDEYRPRTAIIPVVQLPDENTEPAPAPSRKLVKSNPASGIPSVVVAEDTSDESVANDVADSKQDVLSPLGAISGNAVPRKQHSSGWTDQGAQTILSSKQIDQILMDRITSRPLSPPDSDKAKDQNTSPFATPKARSRPSHQPSVTSLPSQQRRPGSAVSQTSSIQSHPPLPVDHREAIMAAEKRSLDQRPSSPSLMGPPLAPASALRATSAQRPRTPNENGLMIGPATTTTSRGRVRREGSHVSRRSSVSSFASEVEERFNMHPNPALGPHGHPAGTDPRMIQAITQTMIGEFLWKYTRKTVTGEISSSRHRRYFWLHPYTRTLYWSEQDPQSAGKSELRTKSVAIEAVRVVPDDNPYPPGLHCKSLEVVSPGRRIRFTATTSQRHETWFNALSYLLLRNSENGEEQESNASLEDIDEFNPGFRTRSRQTSRLSFSSSRSRASRNWPKQRAGSAMSVRRAATPGRASPALSTPSNYSDQRHSSASRSASRLSTILNTTIKGSFGRKGPNYASSSVHEGSVHTHDHDSEEDLRHIMDRDDRLENVRACCDGMSQITISIKTLLTGYRQARRRRPVEDQPL